MSNKSVQNGYVLWGSLVVVPPQGRQQVLKILHKGHSRMKYLLPGGPSWMQIKRLWLEGTNHVKCSLKVHPWECPAEPWARIHVDFYFGKALLIIVDDHSKWLDVVAVSSSSQQAILVFRRVFSSHGLPQILVTDNRAAFTSLEFQTFVRQNGFKHIRSAPYHPGCPEKDLGRH